MAKEQTTQAPTGAAAINQLIEKLNSLGDTISPAVRSSILDAARDEHSGAAVKALVDDLNKVVNHSRHEDALTLMGGKRLSFTVAFPDDDSEGDDQTATTSYRVTTARKTKGGNSAARGTRKVIVNGTEYPTASAACDALGIDHKGTSAPRVLRAALASKQIESLEFPSDDETANEAANDAAADSASE